MFEKSIERNCGLIPKTPVKFNMLEVTHMVYRAWAKISEKTITKSFDSTFGKAMDMAFEASCKSYLPMIKY